jgi:hypothetical protein
MSDFNAGDDIIDVRDIIARVEELREERDSFCDDEGDIVWSDDNPDDAEELNMLESLLSDLCGYGGDEQWEDDWYPITLIHENYFEQSMDEMVADCYDVPKDLPYWITITLDYDALKQDYSEVEFDGNTYYYR